MIQRLFTLLFLLQIAMISPQSYAETAVSEKAGLSAKADKLQALSKNAPRKQTDADSQNSPSGWVKKHPDKIPATITPESDENVEYEESEEKEPEEPEESVETDEVENIENPVQVDEDEVEDTEEASDIAVFSLPNLGDWQPFVEMDANLFPSFLISTSILKLDPPETQDPTFIGDRSGLAGIAIRNPAKNTRVRLEIKESMIMHAARLDAVLEKENEIYVLCPASSFKFDVMIKQKQPLPNSLIFSVSINSQEPVTKVKNVLIRSINDCPTFYVSQTDNSHADISFMFAAYVNESHPMIDRILQDALKTRIVKGFTGYQSEDGNEVINQVFAIWTALQKKGIKYSSITTPSAYSENVFAQNVRFIEESLNFTQANCVDGCVLIASILYKIGINPFLVLVPGHMYLGFYLDENSENICLLETTMLAEGKGEDFFHEVLKESLEEYEKNEEKFLADNDPDYQIIDIDEARRVGIVPIAFSR
ncbi:MAG: hypothetical protein ACD_39C01492G0002 [uncultured bacterium]|nr:MAG: hypothetical protein ACD_39C01492G0002 [uncultured bacterium]